MPPHQSPHAGIPNHRLALQTRLEQMDLEERVPGESDTRRSTPLGRELHSDLVMVFLGLWDEREIPMILDVLRNCDPLSLIASGGQAPHRDAHAAADAQGRKTPFCLAPLQLIQQRHQDARPGGADRVTERDGPAVHVHFFGP
jgi:hypothetical protein